MNPVIFLSLAMALSHAEGKSHEVHFYMSTTRPGKLNGFSRISYFIEIAISLAKDFLTRCLNSEHVISLRMDSFSQ